MKRRTFLFCLGFSLLGAPLSANPIRGAYVCVPPINPNASPLEFRIRESSTCAEGETLMKVDRQKNGIVLIYPAPVTEPQSPEVTEVLREFKRYHGIKP